MTDDKTFTSAMYFAVWVLGFPYADALATVRRADQAMREHWADLGRWHSRSAFEALARYCDDATSGRLAERAARRLPVVIARPSA